jgi:MFS family permease
LPGEPLVTTARDEARPRPYPEQADDAQLEGDLPYVPGSARAALAYRDFRLIWGGAFASNVGTWMQNVALGVFAFQLAHSAGYVSLLGFAQLGPLLALAMVGGALADVVDRKVLLIICQLEQMVMSAVLAWVAASGHPSKVLVFVVVVLVGIGNAINAPTFSSVLPTLVGRRDLPGAVSLQSVQMNVARVIGPAVGGLLIPVVGVGGIFALNAVTYVFAIGPLLVVPLPRVAAAANSGLQRIAQGIRIARQDDLIRQCLTIIATLSFFCLPFIGLMPVLAARNLGIDPESSLYGGLYALFGLGAAAGAVSVGTVFVSQPRRRLVRVGLGAFALSLLAFALVRSAEAAYPVALIVGFTYFVTVTSLSTALQEHIADEVRGRVTALWIMGFGGTIPLGLLAAGAVASASNITVVLLIGAAVAALLAARTRLSLRAS